jgi:tetratricopeptide (TPR) repeat protein
MRLIEALRNSGNATGAARVLELYLHQNPQNVPAQLLAANAFLQAKQWDGAIAVYERLRKRIGDRDATLLNNLAWAYSEKGDHGRALPSPEGVGARQEEPANRPTPMAGCCSRAAGTRRRGLR